MKTMHVFESLFILAVLAGSPPASAHHSVVAFNGEQTVKVTGVVTEFQWMNPHVTIVVEGTAKDAVLKVRWAVEMQAPNAMMEQGWARDTLAIGDRVTIVANPLRRADAAADAIRLLYVGVILPSGKSLGRTGER
jgi:hypothetical protein